METVSNNLVFKNETSESQVAMSIQLEKTVALSSNFLTIYLALKNCLIAQTNMLI